jgi:hypothetical protein
LEGQTVKVVRNGEGGATRGWKPATGKPEQQETDSSGFSTEDRLTTNPADRKAHSGLPEGNWTIGHGIGTGHDFNARLAGLAPAG